jgi:hypothetical protein
MKLRLHKCHYSRGLQNLRLRVQTGSCDFGRFWGMIVDWMWLTLEIDLEDLKMTMLRYAPTEQEKACGMVRPFRQAFSHNQCGTAHMWSKEEALMHSKRRFARTTQHCKRCKKDFPIHEFTFNVPVPPAKCMPRGSYKRESMADWELGVVKVS